MKAEPASPHSHTARPVEDDAAIRRAWELLGHASAPEIPANFAAGVLAAVAKVPQEPRPSVILKFVRLGLPLAAAATLMFSLAGNVFSPGEPPANGVAKSAASAASANASSANLAELARMDAALSLLPEDPELAVLDPAVLELASITDPSEVTDEQILGLLY